MLHGASLDLQLLQLAPGSHPADAALQVDDGLQATLVPAAGQPAADALLNDHHLVCSQQLQADKRDEPVRGFERADQRLPAFISHC